MTHALRLFRLLLVVYLMMVASPYAISNPLSQKGRWIAVWGWNRAAYTKSNYHFKGQGYDFRLYNVKAEDAPTPFSIKDYFSIDRLTVPQNIGYISYFLSDKYVVSISFDHMKYVMKQNQTVKYDGYIDNSYSAAVSEHKTVDLSTPNFLSYEHTDGLNYINIGVARNKEIVTHKKINLLWQYGPDIGFVMPKTNAVIFGNERSDRFHVAGLGADLQTSLSLVIWQRLVFRGQIKAGYIYMPYVKTTKYNSRDNASQGFGFLQCNAGVGYTFMTPKFKNKKHVVSFKKTKTIYSIS